MEFREEEHPAEVDPIERIAGEQIRERVAGAITEVARRHERCGAILVALLESLDEGGTPREISQRALERARESLGEITSGNFHVMLHRCRGRLREQLGDLEEAGSR